MERRGGRKGSGSGMKKKGGKKGTSGAGQSSAGSSNKGTKRKFPTLAGMSFAPLQQSTSSNVKKNNKSNKKQKRNNNNNNNKQQPKGKANKKDSKPPPAQASSASGSGYAGWVPPQRRGGQVAVEELAGVGPAEAPQRVWERYVATRRPVVLRAGHHLLGPEWRASTEWASLERLRERAGSAAVKVERRDSSRGRFGEGREVRTTFGTFLDGLAAGDDLHYMTTQDITRDPDGRPEIIAPPLTLLADDFPLRPALMGHLVPASLNLWMGNSREGSMSGLHHDYHDNLYVLLKGRKRFQLFPPSDAARMYTQGRIVRVHPNGLISYQRGVRSDGADAGVEAAVAAEEAHARAEEELAAAEAAAERGEPGADERLRAAEAALESALDDVLAAQMDGDDEGEGDGDDGDDDVFAGKDDFDDFDDDDDDEAATTKKQKKNKKEKNKNKSEDEEETEMVRIKDADGSGPALPQNFSKVDMTLPADEREARWPLLREASMIECEVRAGDMLFLPAGWFHNVTSFSDNDAGLHMAFNYWFHPPDASTYAQPYHSNFWQHDWEARTPQP
ncbi:uncharacterized protein ACA1_247230 [Acanthamoeba castellanii str. Neff]|uniref:JmjC domain-containing protein n=1 Tax=Acanthamoeba castellanii (strain ATCC 30010 / Neff) TaxID=1257118 RepID=L8GL11_ACACF|nr:uncharacterized protein ACA1_247230 [Acanthamoeba castellanii str. Neff]ELR13519.1 hypothetical protein ACA1_247230 [Acanthamoeba castellanii str. Neff]